jgi:hypothetical protein
MLDVYYYFLNFNIIVCKEHITIFLKCIHVDEYKWYCGNILKHKNIVSQNKIPPTL